MLPFGEDNHRRNINLGGSASQSTHAALLDRARALRTARREDKKKEEAALKIQRWVRPQGVLRSLREELKARFDLGLENTSGTGVSNS